MAQHKSSKKRIIQSEKKRIRNKYFAVTTRNAMKKLKAITVKEEALKELPKISSMLDRLAKRNIIHDNKAANLKSKLTKHIAKL